MINLLSGTPWHISYGDKIKENDKRRHKSKCRYYDRKTKKCNMYFSVCFGSSHCEYYSELKKEDIRDFKCTENKLKNFDRNTRIIIKDKIEQSAYKDIFEIDFINYALDKNKLLRLNIKDYLYKVQLYNQKKLKTYPSSKKIINTLKTEFCISIEKDNHYIYESLMNSRIEEITKIIIDIDKFILSVSHFTNEIKKDLESNKKIMRQKKEFKSDMEIITKENELKIFLVGRKYLEWVAYNFKISDNAEIKMLEKDQIFNRDLKSSILKSLVAWKIRDNRIAIALDYFNYIIVENDKITNTAVIVTFLNTQTERNKDKSVVEQMYLDYKKFTRR